MMTFREGELELVFGAWRAEHCDLPDVGWPRGIPSTVHEISFRVCRRRAFRPCAGGSAS